MSAVMPSANPPSPLQSGTFDVIVVGARVAGAATAMLLARQGLKTLLVDHQRANTDALSTHALMRAGVLQLARWRLLEHVVAASTPPIGRTTFVYGDEPIVITIKPSDGVDALYAPRRTVLDPILVSAAVDAGAEVHHQTTVTDLMRRGDRVVGVRAETCAGQPVELRARLVVGADGIRSTVANRTGAPFTRLGRHASATTYGYWSGLDTNGYEWIFRPNAASGIIPTNDGQTCVFASAPADRIQRGGTGVIREIVAQGSREVARRLSSATPPMGTRTWPGHRGFIRRSHGPGWALVGDAGYYKDPISAHGITDALRDAELLARSILTCFADDASERDALADYEATRDRLSLPLFEVVDRIASHEWDEAEISDLLLRLNSAMASEIETLAALDPVGRL